MAHLYRIVLVLMPHSNQLWRNLHIMGYSGYTLIFLYISILGKDILEINIAYIGIYLYQNINAGSGWKILPDFVENSWTLTVNRSAGIGVSLPTLTKDRIEGKCPFCAAT